MSHLVFNVAVISVHLLQEMIALLERQQPVKQSLLCCLIQCQDAVGQGVQLGPDGVVKAGIKEFDRRERDSRQRLFRWALQANSCHRSCQPGERARPYGPKMLQHRPRQRQQGHRVIGELSAVVFRRDPSIGRDGTDISSPALATILACGQRALAFSERVEAKVWPLRPRATCSSHDRSALGLQAFPSYLLRSEYLGMFIRCSLIVV